MRAASAPDFFANFVRRIASRVLFEPVPATTLTRRRACSQTMAMTRSCSSCERVGLSPVVPTGLTQSVPISTCQSTSRRNAGSSMAPSRNGVTSATVSPLNCSPFVAMLLPVSPVDAGHVGQRQFETVCPVATVPAAFDGQIKLMRQGQPGQAQPHPFCLVEGDAHVFDEMLHEKARIKIVIHDPGAQVRQRPASGRAAPD